MNTETALFNYFLRLGDDALILGQRLGEWCGHAPGIEVDLSVANIGLDLIGQATYFLEEAGKTESKGRDADQLAFHRDVLDYTNCLLVEQPNGDFGQTIARQFLYSTWHLQFMNRLSSSSHAGLAAIAAKAHKEVTYHADFAKDWMIRLGDGTEESHHRISDGVNFLWRFVDELFVMDETDHALLQASISVDKADLRKSFDQAVYRTFKEAGIAMPKPQRPIIGGRKGHHSEHLGHLLSEMQFLPRAYPDARW
jgi:ring-1,2-phenylacetyl-CoA epoxidase subunit PaaC